MNDQKEKGGAEKQKGPEKNELQLAILLVLVSALLIIASATSLLDKVV